MATTNPFDISAKSTGTLTPAPNNVSPLTPNPGPTAAQYTPQLSTVDAGKETTAGQLQSIIAEDSPLMQQARAQAKQGMAQRGLINSSMSQGAGVAAMLERATPIAAADASVFGNRALSNQNAVNTGGQFNAAQQNQFGLQTGQQGFAAAQAALDRAQQTAITDKSIAATSTLAQAQKDFEAAQNALNREQQTSLQTGQQQFTAGQTAVQQNFASAQSALDRAQQTSLTDKSIGAQAALAQAQKDFDSAQNALNREQQTSLQTGQQQFTAGQTAVQQAFASAQSALDRAQQNSITDKSLGAQAALAQAQKDFDAAQNALGREQQASLQTGQQQFTAAQTALERGQQVTVLQAQQNFASAQAQLDRAQQIAVTDKGILAQANLQKAQQDFTGAQSVLDRAQQTSLQTGQQQFAAGQNTIQNDFAARQAELERSGRTTLQAQQIASSEAMARLQEAGVTNRFDKEIALKSSQFSVEQNNLDKRQLIDNSAKIQAIGLQIEANRDNIPTNFAATIVNTTMAGVDAIIADGTLNAAAKQAAINNLVTYANSQINWAAKFFGTTIPPISMPALA